MLSSTPKQYKQKISVNIDTVDFSIAGNFNSLGASIVTSKKECGLIVAEYGNRVPMKGKYGAHNINVRSMNSGKKLQFEGSPFAFLYGQNVYTSSDLLRGCRIVYRHAIKKFGIEPTVDQLERWNSGDIDLTRVDLAVNFQVGSETEGNDVLHQIGRQLHLARSITTILMIYQIVCDLF
jgi:Phage replication protein CRI